MRADKNVPEIRFKGFGGEWERKPLGSLCEIGDIDHRMPESKKTGIPYLMTGDFYGINGLDFKGAKLISVQDYEQLSKKIKPELGDVIFARYASVGAVRYVETDIDFLVSYSCAILKTNNTSYGKYLFYFFQTARAKDLIELDINTGSQRNIGIDSLKNLAIGLPPSNEKIQLGNFFQKLDALINQHQQKHEKLSSIKKAMLEKMFPKKGETIPEIRFKGFSGEWKNSVLSELALFNPKDELPLNFKYVDLESVKGTSLLGYSLESIDSAPSRAQRLAKKGDVFYQTVRPYQKNNYIFNEIDDDYVFSTGYAQLRPYFHGCFLLNLVQRDLFVKKVLDNCTGTSYPAINARVLASLEVSYPESREEQTAIGNFFQKLDTLINQHQQQITKLNNIKQACLSKMFV